MNAIEIDKSKWGSGEWIDEPDNKEWIDESTGYKCMIKRVPDIGHLCGYVGVTAGHPAYEKEYMELQDLDAHGCITFSGFWDDETTYFIGFDCCHAGDLSPAINAFRFNTHGSGTYRNIEYVESEVQKLASQLKAMESNA